jgi:[ribosomal protein S5]-alanine N-acetyltransferase
MIVKGKALYLRTVRETDLDTLYLRQCDIEQRGLYFPIYIGSETAFKDEFRKDGFANNEHGRYLICDFEDRVLGEMYYFRATPYFDGYEVGYRLFEPATLSRRGTMTEALLLCTYVLFVSQKINRLELKIMPQNAASKRVAEKCGYQYEGTARACMFHRGEYRDMEIYSILRAEAPGSLEEALTRI